MPKISSTKSAKPKKGEVEIGDCNKAERNRSEIGSGEVDGVEVRDDEVGKKVQKTSKSKNLTKFKKTVGSLNFPTSRAKLAFTKLKQAFFKTPILHYVNPECHIYNDVIFDQVSRSWLAKQATYIQARLELLWWFKRATYI